MTTPAQLAEFDRDIAEADHGLDNLIAIIRRNEASGMSEYRIMGALVGSLALMPAAYSRGMLATALRRLAKQDPGGAR